MLSEEGSVELVDVTKRFADVVAVDSLSLQVQPAEFLSLLGPSGCGKTTTLRMLAGFEEPTAGEIFISGQAVQGTPPHKRNVNTVFQHFALFPHMSVAENVAYGLRQKKEEKSQIASKVGEALEMVKMSPLANRKPRQLSGGQQQRVALARALVNRPSLLLLDEPLGALDRKLREEMQIELKLLQSQVGITFIFVTHDQGEALSMSDRIAVMLDGHVEQLADPDTIYDSPASAFVAGFIGQQNFFDGKARENGSVVEGDGWTIRSSNQSPDAVDGRPALAAIRPEAVQLRGGATGGPGELGPRDAGRYLAPRRRDPVRGPHEGAEGDPLPAPPAEGTEARGGRGRLVHVGARPGPRVRRATGGGGPRGPGRDRNGRIGGTGWQMSWKA